MWMNVALVVTVICTLLALIVLEVFHAPVKKDFMEIRHIVKVRYIYIYKSKYKKVGVLPTRIV